MSKIALEPNVAGTGTFSIAAPNSNTNRTLTLPDVSGEVVLNEGSGTFKIDASGNVGIGTSSPSSQDVSANNLVVEDTAGNGGITIKTPTSAYGSLHFSDGTGADAYRGIVAYNHADNSMQFSTNSTERLRIDASGNLLVRTTSPTTTGVGGATFSTAAYARSILALGSNSTISGMELVHFYNPNGLVGRIETNASSTSYITSSDYRLKDDIQPIAGAAARLLQLKPCNFAWKVDGSRTDGFLAHEVQDVVPEAASGVKDAVDADGNPVYQGIDQSKIVPLLTAALQEALTKIDALTARIVTLEAKP